MTKPNTSLYLPMPSAVEAGVLDLDELQPHLPQDAALLVSNACMPDRAGVVDLGGGKLGAFDLVNVVGVSREQIIVSPLPKTSVAEEGKVVTSGRIVLTTTEIAREPATIRQVAEALPWQLAQWREGFTRIGDIGIRHLFGTQAFPIRDITHDGGLVASNRQRYF